MPVTPEPMMAMSVIDGKTSDCAEAKGAGGLCQKEDVGLIDGSPEVRDTRSFTWSMKAT